MNNFLKFILVSFIAASVTVSSLAGVQTQSAGFAELAPLGIRAGGLVPAAITIVTPTPLSPSGSIIDTTPTYAWSKIAGATKYQYRLYKGKTLYYAKTVPASACKTSTCSNTPTSVLPYAAYSWKVRALVSGVWRAYSALKAFTVVNLIPKPIAPTGTIADTTPTFTWSKIARATQYQYRLYKGGILYYSKTIPASACKTSTCSNTPTSILADAFYSWKVRALVGGIWKPFSALKPFTLITYKPEPQGLSPFDIEVTKDGQYAYIGFDLSEVIFKVRLTDLSIVATADLSAYFPMESEQIALDASEKKLFVYTPTWRKLLVLDTETMSLIHTIDDYGLIGMFRTQFSSHLITWDGGPTVQFVDTDTYTVTQQTDDNLFFMKIQEHKDDQTKWYVVTQGLPGGQGPLTVGLYDYVTKSWSNSVTFPLQAAGSGIFDFRVLPNGQKAYVATFGGWYPDFHAYGWLYAVDLVTQQVKVVSIDGGAMCLEANPTGTQIYVGTGWPLPNTNNLLVVDTASDSVVGSIPLGRNSYGWPYTQMNNLQIDPAHSNLLYATSTDGNAVIKIDIDSLTLTNVRVLNNESLQPHYFVRRPTQPFGNILLQHNAKSFELNLDTATIQNLVTFPAIRQDVGMYDIGVLNTGRLLIAQGEQFLEVDPQGMQLVATHPLNPDTPTIWNFVLSNDKSKIYTVTYDSDGTPNIFTVLNTTTFHLEKLLDLAGGGFEFRPFELPDGSKLYALGGLPNGPVVIHVIGTTDYTIQKTITFDQSDRLGISAGPGYPYAYDPVSQTLFVGATHVVLAIDTSTDVIKNVIDLGDVATAIGLQPSQVTYLNAGGLVYNPMENYLYIAHVDRSFVSIYDLTNRRFLPKVIPLKGYFPNSLFINDAHDKIYSINIRSDSVSVINVSSKTVENVIDLHFYLPEP